MFTASKRKGLYSHWEPIYVGTHQEPLYDERLSWEGRSDKMTQVNGFYFFIYEWVDVHTHTDESRNNAVKAKYSQYHFSFYILYDAFISSINVFRLQVNSNPLDIPDHLTQTLPIQTTPIHTPPDSDPSQIRPLPIQTTLIQTPPDSDYPN